MQSGSGRVCRSWTGRESMLAPLQCMLMSMASMAVSCACCVCASPPPDLSTVRFVAGGNPADAAFQLKSLVKALHAAGIEVLLEVRALQLTGQLHRPQQVCLCPGPCTRRLRECSHCHKRAIEAFCPSDSALCLSVRFHAPTNCRLMGCAFLALRLCCPKPSTG